MKQQAFNPYLPSWEYIPDGEPRLFNDRVYIYGSHDHFNGYAFCLDDYVTWSAPADDLSDWRYEGVIYKRTDDPNNKEGLLSLFAPDVIQGTDGRYYLYYVMDKLDIVSVAVCDTPAGQFEFYGHVHYEDGTFLGNREGDMPQFDPGVLCEGDRTYLYTGFCPQGEAHRKGATVTVLGADMLTVIESPKIIIPGVMYADNTSFKDHAFFEAPSVRKVNGKYYLIYSSILYAELCYAVSDTPNGDFVFGGVIVANNDVGVDTYKPADMPMFYGGNNHGSILEIKNQWYIFYHRHTNGTHFSRQACAEAISILEDGSIPQVEMTSCGLNGKPLIGQGEYATYIACNLYCKTAAGYTGEPFLWLDNRFPKITQDGSDAEKNIGHIENLRDGATAGFKYFECKGVQNISVTCRAGGGGKIEILTQWDGVPLGEIPIGSTTEWMKYSAPITIPDGVHALYFRYRGDTTVSLKSFVLE